MKKDKGKLNLIIKVGLIVGILLISVSIFYYLVVFLPKKEKSNKELWLRIGAGKAKCLNETDRRYHDYWNRMCQGRGLNEDCKLPKYDADRAEQYKESERAACFKLFEK